jgi:hypothetical protein
MRKLIILLLFIVGISSCTTTGGIVLNPSYYYDDYLFRYYDPYWTPRPYIYRIYPYRWNSPSTPDKNDNRGRYDRSVPRVNPSPSPQRRSVSPSVSPQPRGGRNTQQH